MSDYKRVLSIDGGGIRGIYPATILAEIEKRLPEPLYQYFDLITGTSTGGIIALAIGLGFDASEIVGFYEKFGPKIFGGWRSWRWLRHWVTTKYDDEELKRALEDTFGEKYVGDSKTRLVIPSMVPGKGVYLYKTCHRNDFERDYWRKATEAAMATAAAPTYFPAYTNETKDILVDGGTWANNPILFGLMDGIGILNWKKDEIKVLSISCIEKSLDHHLPKRKGKIAIASHLTDLFMSMQSNSALSASQTLIGADNIFRLTDVGDFELDSVKQLPEMKALAENRINAEIDKLMPVFFDVPVSEAFKPYRTVEDYYRGKAK